MILPSANDLNAHSESVAEIDARCNLIGQRRQLATTKAEAEMAEQMSRAEQRLDQQVGILQVESEGGVRLKAER